MSFRQTCLLKEPYWTCKLSLMPSVLHKSSVAVWEYSSSKTFTVYNIAVVITQKVEEKRQNMCMNYCSQNYILMLWWKTHMIRGDVSITCFIVSLFPGYILALRAEYQHEEKGDIGF